MEIVGYVAYASLVVLAIAWTIDVRTDLGADTPAILRAVYFVLAAALIAVFDMNWAHALWLVPFGCFFARIVAPVLIEIPVISAPFIVVAGIFERLVRIGVPRHKILEAQSASMHACADGCCKNSEHN